MIKYLPEEEEDAHEKKKVEDHRRRCYLYLLANITTRESCKKLAYAVAGMRVIDISFNICFGGN